MSDQKPHLLRIPDGFRMLTAVSFIFIMMSFASCEKGCLCHTETGRIRVCLDADWAEFNKEEPTGMTVMFENEATGEISKLTTHKINQPEALLCPGRYKVLGINQSPNEFGSMKFEGGDALDRAIVVGEQMEAPSWFDFEGRIIEEPEWLAIGRIQTKVEGNGYFGTCGCISCECVAFHGQTDYLGTLQMSNVIWSLRIEIEIEGTEYLSKIRGAILGVPEGLALWSADSYGESAQLLTDWKNLTTGIRSFGISDMPELILQFLLIDGKTIIDHYVKADSLTIVKDEIGKVVTINAIIKQRLPEVSAPMGGGFDATVDDWGVPGDIELPM